MNYDSATTSREGIDMSQPKQRLSRVVWCASTMLTVVGCGSAASDKQSISSSATAAASTTSAATSTSSLDASAPSPGTYQTKIFQPGFSVDVPAGWIVLERDTAAAQIYVQCDTCEHSGEENGEITLDATLAALPLEDVIARLNGASHLAAEPASPIQLGSVAGFKFTATRTGEGEVAFADSGYHSEADGEPIDVLAIDVGGRTVTIYVDPHAATGAAAQEFAAAAAAILESIQFAS